MSDRIENVCETPSGTPSKLSRQNSQSLCHHPLQSPLPSTPMSILMSSMLAAQSPSSATALYDDSESDSQLERCAICLSPLKRKSCFAVKRKSSPVNSIIGSDEYPLEHITETIESSSLCVAPCTPDNNSIEETQCKHIFHKRCLVNIRNNKCPICRRPLVASADQSAPNDNNSTNSNSIYGSNNSNINNSFNILESQYQDMIFNFFQTNIGIIEATAPPTTSNSAEDSIRRQEIINSTNRRRNAVRLAMARREHQFLTTAT